ncbi:MAG TPA: alpha-amylase family glycosyl hydrolase [Flavisolibacter sp.]|nr:alpha-amylase family glycosyl hydrolase [Flavisolibacter sp.]
MFRILLILSMFTGILSCNGGGEPMIAGRSEDSPEVIYHMVQRSFFDSNGDLHGDLAGLRQKLDYLQDLGITSVLLLPLYESVYYHNYFSGDFEKIDGEFGTKEDYLSLIKEMHRRGMKLYMDMETQYVTEDHLWYRDSYKNPASPYSDYLLYNGPGNTDPETIIFNLSELKGYDDTVRKITTVNLNHPKVKEYNYRLFSYWVDPNGDGVFDDGVDGFRLDHMMDDLDNKGKWKDLFTGFWKPLITKLKQVNPKLSFVAEQADWASLGLDYLEKGGVDRVFAFRVGFEIRDLNKQKLGTMADSVFGHTPPSKGQLVFIENHDMSRFAHVAQQHPGKLRVGAALNLLVGGIPSIYYGQELGMTGWGGFMRFGMTDANDIPVREAFEWYKSDTGRGMALWYKHTGPWWDSTNLKPNDGISVEEQQADTASLLHFYKRLIALRKKTAPLAGGAYQTLHNNSDSVFSFLRYRDGKAAIVIVNLGGQPAELSVGLSGHMDLSAVQHQVFGSDRAKFDKNRMELSISAHAVNVWEGKVSEKR